MVMLLLCRMQSIEASPGKGCAAAHRSMLMYKCTASRRMTHLLKQRLDDLIFVADLSQEVLSFADIRRLMWVLWHREWHSIGRGRQSKRISRVNGRRSRTRHRKSSKRRQEEITMGMRNEGTEKHWALSRGSTNIRPARLVLDPESEWRIETSETEWMNGARWPTAW